MKRTGSFVFLVASALALTCIVAAGCSRDEAGDESDRPKVAVSTSWLACALRDVSGEAFEVVWLSSPGSCPGHFDMKPSQLAEIRKCLMLVRFDFQEKLDDRLARMKGEGLIVAPVTAGEGMCIPETYRGACEELASTVSEAFPDMKTKCAETLAATTKRLDALATEARNRVKSAGLSGKKALASRHQAAFARWLGLDVVGTFRGSDSQLSADLNDMIRRAEAERVEFVIATLQEGDALARQLARRLDARLVVFSNFPTMTDAQRTFDDLVLTNVNALLEAARE